MPPRDHDSVHPGRTATRRRPRTRRTPGQPRRARPAFTLLETMLALTIILVGVLAVMQAQRAFLFNNLWSSHGATANYLANEIREMTRAFPRHDRFSGGLYFTTPGVAGSFEGWGPEANEIDPDSLDDLDDLDGAVFGDATTLPEGFDLGVRYDGPVNAFGEVITETLWDGTTETVEVDEESVEVSMRGWTQVVEVDKVDPTDFSVALEDAFFDDGVRDVDEFPVRITVSVLYQGPWATGSTTVSSVSWVVSP